MMATAPNTVPDQPRQDFRPWVVYLVCLGVSIVFMFFFGLNSPIHTFNTHCDYQWYLTMGNGILAGKVPYRDLFDQKGPIVYAVFAVACLFPNEQFVIWCFEIFSVSLFLFFCYRIARKFLSPWLSLAVVPLTMMVLSANYIRGLDGSCVEEYCLPIFAYGLLCFLDFMMDQRPATWRRSLVLGLCFGLLLWVKFSLWEFLLVPMLIWLSVNLVRCNFLTILRSGLMMLGGVLLVTIPVIVIFAATGALDDLFTLYFKLNLFSYTGDYEGSDGVEHLNHPWKNFAQSFFIGPYCLIVIAWGLICFAVQYWRQKSGWLLLVAVIPTWLMIGFFCGYLYYYLPLFVYAVLGVIYAVKVVAHMLQAVGVVIKRRWVSVLWISLVTVVSFFLALPFVSNVTEINRPRTNYAPLVVADIIAEYNRNAEQSATLFCYRMSDGGFYNAAGIVPNVRFYAQNSFTKESFPAMFDAFDDTIRDQICDFVITTLDTYWNHETLLVGYYHPYFGTVEDSTLDFVWFEPSGYLHNQIIILFRN